MTVPSMQGIFEIIQKVRTKEAIKQLLTVEPLDQIKLYALVDKLPSVKAFKKTYEKKQKELETKKKMSTEVSSQSMPGRSAGVVASNDTAEVDAAKVALDAARQFAIEDSQSSNIKETEYQQQIENFKQQFNTGKLEAIKKITPSHNLWAEIKGFVDKEVKPEEKIEAMAQLRDEFKCTLDDAKPIEQEERLAGTQTNSIDRLFEGLLESNPEELKDIEPFKSIKGLGPLDAEDFKKRAREVFSNANSEGGNFIAQQNILIAFANYLVGLVENEGDTQKAITAMKLKSDGRILEVFDNNNSLFSEKEKEKSTTNQQTTEEASKKLKVFRAKNALSIYSYAYVKKMNTGNNKGTGEKDKDIEVDKIERERYIKEGFPARLKHERINELQKKLIEGMAELKEKRRKQVAAGTNNHAELEAEMQKGIKNLEESLLKKNGFLPISVKVKNNKDAEEVGGVYFCRNEEDNKAVYMLIGDRSNFKNQLDAVIAHNRTCVGENGKPVTMGYCNLINIGKNEQDMAIEECLRQNSQFGFNGKEHAYSIALREINKIGHGEKKSVFDVLENIPGLTLFNSNMKGQKRQLKSTNRENFLKLTNDGSSPVKQVIVGQLESLKESLSGNNGGSFKKAAEKALKMLKGTADYGHSDGYVQLETALREQEQKEAQEKSKTKSLSDQKTAD